MNNSLHSLKFQMKIFLNNHRVKLKLIKEIEKKKIYIYGIKIDALNIN